MHILYQGRNFIIREFLAEEQHLFCNLFKDTEVTQYLPSRSPEQYVEIFNGALVAYTESLFSRFGIFDSESNDFIGMCLIRNFADVIGQIEIGYTLNKKYWGRGIATEVSRALIRYCFVNTEINQVVAVTDLDNIGSQKVLEKAGFIRSDNLKREDAELAYYIIERS